MGQSHFNDLRNAVLQQVIRRKTQQDIVSPVSSAPAASNEGRKSYNGMNTSVDTNTAFQSLVLCLAGSAITLSWITQLRSWYLERYRERLRDEMGASWTGGGDSTVPPPPPHRPKDLAVVREGCCPLCGGKPRVLPTVCASSGYVFCLPCIRPFVQEHGTCPVSGKTVANSQLVRLFEPTELRNATSTTAL